MSDSTESPIESPTAVTNNEIRQAAVPGHLRNRSSGTRFIPTSSTIDLRLPTRSRPSSLIMAENDNSFLNAASASAGNGFTPGTSRASSTGPANGTPQQPSQESRAAGNEQPSPDLQSLLALLIEGQLKGKRGGKLPEPGGKQLPLFDSEGVTDYLINFNFYANQSGLTDYDRLEQFPIFCEKPIRTLVQSKAEEAKRGGGWEEFMTALKKEFWAEDPEQTEEPSNRLRKWLVRLRFSTDGSEFRKQRREFERLLTKAGHDYNTTFYSKELMTSLPKEARSAIFFRLGKTRQTADTISYRDLMEQMNNYMDEQGMSKEEESDEDNASDSRDNVREPIRTLVDRDRGYDEPKEKTDPIPPVSILKRAPGTIDLDELSNQFAQMQVKLNELAARPATIGGPSRGIDPYSRPAYDYTASLQYPIYQQDIQQGYIQPPRGRGRGGMARGRPYGNGRGQGYNQGNFGPSRCYYCGQLGHTLYDCHDYNRDCEQGLIHKDPKTGCIHFGENHEMGEPIPNSIFHHFKESGKIRSVVWSLLEMYPNRPGAAAMRRVIKDIGERVDTDIQFTTSRYVNPGRVVPAEPIANPTAALIQSGDVLPTNYLQVYDDLDFASLRAQTPSPFAVDLVEYEGMDNGEALDTLLNGVKRGRVSSVVDDDGTETTASGATPDQSSRGAPNGAVLDGQDKARSTQDERTPFSSLIESTARAAMDSKMRLTLHQVGQLNSMVARQLADTFSDMADSIESTVHVDFSGRVVKETKGSGSVPRKRIKLVDKTSDQTPDIVPVNLDEAMAAAPKAGGLVNALGQLKVIVGNTMLEGAALSAIVDSGSAANTISEANALRAGLAIAPTKAVSRSFHGTLSRFRGTVMTNVWIGGHALTMRFFVNPTPQRGGEEDRPLFGMPFFHQTKFTFSYGDQGELFGKLLVGRTRIVMPMIRDQSLLPNELVEGSGKD